MNKYKISDFHVEAMKSASLVLEQAIFARTFITPEELDYSWGKALALLESQGRAYSFSGYNNASPTPQNAINQ